MQKSAVFLREKLKKDGKNPLQITCCKEISNSQNQKNRILVLYIDNLEIYNEDRKLVSYFWWCWLTGADFSLNRLTLQFGKSNFTFDSQDVIEIQKKLYDIIPQNLSNLELHVKDMIPFLKIKSKPNLTSFLTRIKAKADELGIREYGEILEKAREIYFWQKSQIIFSEFSDVEKAMNLLLNGIQVLNFVTTIVIPSNVHFDPFPILTSFASKNTYVEYIKIEGALTSSFSNFLLAIRNNKTAKIGGLCFTNTEFKESDLEALSKTLSEKEIIAFGMKNCLNDQSAINSFSQFFLESEITTKLKKLCLSSFIRSKSLTIESILSKMNSLAVLSLTYSDIDLSKALSSLPTCKLKTIDLSGNKYLRQITQMKLPSTLINLKLRDVKWSDSTLSSFFVTLSRSCNTPLSLDLSRADASVDEWLKFFINSKKFYFSDLKELYWEYNPVHPKFFKYLQRNKNIQTLSMKCCFNEENSSSLISFCSFISRDCERLRKLIISSDQYNYIGKYIVPILIAVQLSTPIEYLDITGSRCGNSGMSQLISLLKNVKSLQTVHFDGSYPTSCSIYADLIETINTITKERDVYFSWPEEDLRRLTLYYKMRYQKYIALRELFSKEDHFVYCPEENLDFNELCNTENTFSQYDSDLANSTRNKNENPPQIPKLSVNKTTLEFNKERRHTRIQTLDPSSVKASPKVVLENASNNTTERDNNDIRRKRRSLDLPKIPSDINQLEKKKDDTVKTQDPEATERRRRSRRSSLKARTKKAEE